MIQHWLYPFRNKITSFEILRSEIKVGLCVSKEDLNLDPDPDPNNLKSFGISEVDISFGDPALIGRVPQKDMNITLTFDLRHADNRSLLQLN